MRLIFFGTPEFASRCLQKILLSRHEVAAVVTAPDRPRGRGRKSAMPEVKKLALERGLEVLQPERLKDLSFLGRLDAIGADFYCVVAFRILPEEVFSKPSRGCVNLHASLLPRYRGAAPINWALINGEKETGLTTFFIGRKVDTGDIILQEKMKIGSDETFGELHDRMAEAGGDLLIKTMDRVESGEFKAMKQDNSVATPAPKLSPELGVIDWGKSAQEIHNLVRGLSPRPGAYSFLGGNRIMILRTRVNEGLSPGFAPGKITLADPKRGVSVACGGGEIMIVILKPESGREMTATDYVRGHRIEAGVQFSNRREISTEGQD